MRRRLKLLIIPLILFTIAVSVFVPDDTVSAQIEPTPQLEWSSFYYANTTRTDPLWRVLYSGELALNFGTGAPTNPDTGIELPEIPVNNWSARYSSSPTFNTGIYDFTVIADGGVRLTINTTVVIDNLDNTGLRTFTGRAFIGSGANSVVLEYIDYAGDALIEITWVDVSDSVPDPDTDDDTDQPLPGGATAVVSGVDGLSLRSGPYLGASLIAVLRPGITYSVTAQNNFEGTYTWYKIVTNPAGQTGWASGRYLDINLLNTSSYSCNVTPEFAASIAGGITDPSQQVACTVATISAINSRDENNMIPPENINDVLTQCDDLFVDGVSISTVLDFIDTTENRIATTDVCTTTTTPGVSIPVESTVFETLFTLPDTGVTIAPRTVMNIRVRPSTRVGIAGQIPWGAEAQLLARTVEAGTDHWYLIRYDGIIGWVDASFVNVRGNIVDVPIY